MKICFVCLGNICRSPTAEGVMRRLVEEAGLGERVVIDSAGTGSWHVGELPDPRTRAAAKRRGIELVHRARQLAAGDLVTFDLVLAMDARNLAHVEQMRSRGGGRARAEVKLLRSFDATAPADAEVPDPYEGGDAGFEEVLDQCERACAGLLAHLRGRL
ncbi:MAG: low molecular weight phosphotyrosine protein phosphatase [Deltaproteobacteria bacterium]|nr:low molecular weight phosphotyrosine protein phosphatase [Deltaproteobacteria bacterium]MCW5803822.1 low molecular weight phosphotyrosine protein phosphatase [Deltaproteobacteria bacterium]